MNPFARGAVKTGERDDVDRRASMTLGKHSRSVIPIRAPLQTGCKIRANERSAQRCRLAASYPRTASVCTAPSTPLLDAFLNTIHAGRRAADSLRGHPCRTRSWAQSKQCTGFKSLVNAASSEPRRQACCRLPTTSVVVSTSSFMEKFWSRMKATVSSAHAVLVRSWALSRAGSVGNHARSRLALSREFTSAGSDTFRASYALRVRCATVPIHYVDLKRRILYHNIGKVHDHNLYKLTHWTASDALYERLTSNVCVSSSTLAIASEPDITTI
ncbi:hypothetical protein GY45DRAFT_649703 [Cubamyces sp. BRFM 1775]|nr:hypothetical protein GY45DRAFT_649703 [Cubamyces sp. BRFM 1775]